MSPDDHPVDPIWPKRSASLAVPGHSRRWPVRRLDLELFLSADARKHRQRPGLHEAMETERGDAAEGDPR